MKKVWIIVIISIVLLAIGGITGIYIYNINNTLNQNSIKAKELADELKRKMIEEENRTVSTSSNTVKTSPNSIVQKNTVYKICNALDISILDLMVEDEDGAVRTGLNHRERMRFIKILLKFLKETLIRMESSFLF